MKTLPFERAKRKIIIKNKSETDPKHGCNPEKRPVEELLNYGVIDLDKPKGPTSHQVSAFVQQILNIKKSGHSGTLDPAVTGVLPVALGRATKVIEVLLNAGKEYVAIMHLHKEVEEDKIRKTCDLFTGRIKQLPPVKSAVKREWRYRKVYYFEILEIDGKDVLFKTGCQAGTYIRKLIHDIGEELGGAHMAELRRTKAGPFNEDSLVTLQDLTDAYHYYKNKKSEKFIRKVIMPIEEATEHMPKIWVNDNAIDSLCHGADLGLPGISKYHSGIQKGDLVVIMSLKNELIALGESRLVSKDLVKDKGIAVKTTKVFMLPGIYPKIKKE
jgi:H/ACA ribonucleoprotein complex subunit 4